MADRSKTDYDVIIVGGGPAGMTAALFACRRALRTLVVTQDIGGQAGTTDEIENYPGVDLIDGPTLMGKFRAQAETFGAEFYFEEATAIKPDVAHADKAPIFEVATKTKKWRCFAVIMANGLTRRHLGIPGEEEFYGKGVVYTASEEAEKYKDKVCAVVGGGNSAAQAALLLAEVCTKVYLIHRRDEFRAEATQMERMKKHNTIDLLLDCEVAKINGRDWVQSISCVNNKTNEQRELSVDGIFIEVGFIVKKDLLQGLAETNERGNLVINAKNETTRPGLLAAGDISSITYKQIVISAGEGAKAAMTAQKYLQTHGLIKAVVTDWGRIAKQKP